MGEMKSKILSVTLMKWWKIELPNQVDVECIGFDPGSTHIGIAWNTIGSDQGFVVQIDKSRTFNPIERMKEVHAILHEIFPFTANSWDVLAVIEGASFGDRFRQVELAEVRATIAWWAINNHLRGVHIVPPMTIRKTVFGNAKLRAQDVWDNSEIPNDALAALSCMYYANTIKEN